MKLRVLGYALLVTLFGMLDYSYVSGSQLWERKVKEDRKIQEVIQSKHKEQESLRERLKVAGLKEEDVKPFFEAIQKAVEQSDAVALSKIVKYPITLKTPKGQNIKVPDSKEFVANYPRFITPNWRKAVLEQKYKELFANWQGVMIGRGEIWFSSICMSEPCSKYELKITGINPWFAD
ncbi:MAG: hypothetical protein HC770_03935 [Pseudanabaena sp. CRU_2_10]|nr:hypothetical protein [Pseudanabaena sp. CRU_2_10]